MTTPSNAALAKAAELAQRIIDNPGWGATWADNVVRPIAEAYLDIRPDATDVRTMSPLGTRTPGTVEVCEKCNALIDNGEFVDPGRGTCIEVTCPILATQRPAPASAAPSEPMDTCPPRDCDSPGTGVGLMSFPSARPTPTAEDREMARGYLAVGHWTDNGSTHLDDLIALLATVRAVAEKAGVERTLSEKSRE